MFLVFFLAILLHEFTHILIAWYYSKNIPTIRFKFSYIKIIPKSIFNDKEKSIFLGVPIIVGMFSIYPFFHFYPVESSFSMISYLISCGKDFYSLIEMEVERIKWKRKD